MIKNYGHISNFIKASNKNDLSFSVYIGKQTPTEKPRFLTVWISFLELSLYLWCGGDPLTSPWGSGRDTLLWLLILLPKQTTPLGAPSGLGGKTGTAD